MSSDSQDNEPEFGQSVDYHREKIQEMNELPMFQAASPLNAGKVLKQGYFSMYHFVGMLVAFYNGDRASQQGFDP